MLTIFPKLYSPRWFYFLPFPGRIISRTLVWLEPPLHSMLLNELVLHHMICMQPILFPKQLRILIPLLHEFRMLSNTDCWIENKKTATKSFTSRLDRFITLMYGFMRSGDSVIPRNMLPAAVTLSHTVVPNIVCSIHPSF